jgi:hypothetical protein
VDVPVVVKSQMRRAVQYIPVAKLTVLVARVFDKHSNLSGGAIRLGRKTFDSLKSKIEAAAALFEDVTTAGVLCEALAMGLRRSSG